MVVLQRKSYFINGLIKWPADWINDLSIQRLQLWRKMTSYRCLLLPITPLNLFPLSVYKQVWVYGWRRACLMCGKGLCVLELLCEFSRGSAKDPAAPLGPSAAAAWRSTEAPRAAAADRGPTSRSTYKHKKANFVFQTPAAHEGLSTDCITEYQKAVHQGRDFPLSLI